MSGRAATRITGRRGIGAALAVLVAVGALAGIEARDPRPADASLTNPAPFDTSEIGQFLIVGLGAAAAVGDAVNINSFELGADLAPVPAGRQDNPDQPGIAPWISGPANSGARNIPTNAKPLGTTATYDGNVAVVDGGGTLNYQNVGVYADPNVGIRCANTTANCQSTSSNSFFNPPKRYPNTFVANAGFTPAGTHNIVGSGALTDPGDAALVGYATPPLGRTSDVNFTTLNADLTAARTWIMAQPSTCTLFASGGKITPTATVGPGNNVYLTGAGCTGKTLTRQDLLNNAYDPDFETWTITVPSGTHVIDINPDGGNDFLLEQVNLVVDGAADSFVIFRQNNDKDFKFTNANMLVGTGGIGLTNVLVYNDSDVSSNHFDVSNNVVNGVSFWTLNPSGNGAIPIGNSQGCAQFVADKITYNNTRYNRCAFAFDKIQHDFGDNPESYGTRLVDNGPRHIVAPSNYWLSMGPTVDMETDIPPDPDANFPGPAVKPNPPDYDDSRPSWTQDDEDGVTISPFVGNAQNTITITVDDDQTGAKFINGWFDFNNNGVFDAGESIFSDGVYVSSNLTVSNSGTLSRVSSTCGLAQITGATKIAGSPQSPNNPLLQQFTVTFNVPELSQNFAANDRIYARFRLSRTASEICGPLGEATSGEVEDHSTTITTLPITLASMAVTQTGANVAFDWTTATEVDNAGFRLFAETDGGLVELNDTPLILSHGPNSLDPQQYHYEAKLPGGKDATFWLEDVSLGGATRRHGPFRAGDTVGVPAAPVDPPAARTTASEPLAAAAAAASGTFTYTKGYRGPAARLEVNQAGLHRVTFEQLQAAGVNLTGAPMSELAVTRNGTRVPIRVVGTKTFGPGKALQFFGEPVDTLYTDTNVYLLQVDPNLRANATSANAAPRRGAAATTGPATAAVDENWFYSVAAPGDDPWLRTRLFPYFGSPEPAAQTLPLPAPGAVTTAAAELTVEVWGETYRPNPDEHHVTFAVNGTPVGERVFDDVVKEKVTVAVPAGVLRADGDNTLTVTALTTAALFYDLVAVDQYSLKYEQVLQARGPQFVFTANGGRVEVKGLSSSSLQLFRVDGGLSALSGFQVSPDPNAPGTFLLRFATPSTGGTFAVTTADGFLAPGASAARPAANLLTGSADYLIVTHGSLVDSLGDLVTYHESQGRAVRVVDVADIYQAYRGGVVDAAAIDEFVAAAHRDLGISFVLVAGADHYDYRDYDGDGAASLVPSLYADTGHGIRFAPVDPAYADVDGDRVPDVALGRLPARDAAEMSTMVAKTLAYANGGSAYAGTAVLASDTGFAGVNDVLAGLLPGGDIARADLDTSTVAAARATLLGRIAAGNALVSYVGHSAPSGWSESGLLSEADIEGMVNSTRPTVVSQYGCWNAYYVDPGGITHALLRSAGGAAAAMGASTLTDAGSDAAIARYVTEELAKGSTLGQAVLAAKRGLNAQRSGLLDVQLGWTLLGDPGLAMAWG